MKKIDIDTLTNDVLKDREYYVMKLRLTTIEEDKRILENIISRFNNMLDYLYNLKELKNND